VKYALTTTGCCAAVLLIFSLVAEDAASSAPGATPCADPAADIELALISKSGPTAGRVRITGIVKNLGTVPWTAMSPSHSLKVVLAQRNSKARPDGEPVQPAIAIRQLAPGQQYRIDHQVDWEAVKHASYPRFIVRFSDPGQAGARPAAYRLDCRSANNRKEITAADINKLFQTAAPEKPLKAQSSRLLGGIGVNTVETELVYHRNSAYTGKLTASVAAPYSGTSDEVPISGKSGTAQIRVHIPCDVKAASGRDARPVTITYRLWSSLGLPGGSASAPSFSIKQSIPYHELCGPGPTGKASQ
jgi:hypothetical protein